MVVWVPPRSECGIRALSLCNLIWEVTPGERSQDLRDEIWIGERPLEELVATLGMGAAFCGDILRSSVECASNLLTGRTEVRDIYVPALISHWSRVIPSGTYSLAFQFALV